MYMIVTVATAMIQHIKVDRGQVRVSHCLANWARTERQTLFSFGSGPDVFLQELEQERLVNPIA
jgi:hypothetical protein